MTKRTPHKHAEVIKAWADGATVEVGNPGTLIWWEAKDPTFDVRYEYRVKPEPVVDYTIVFSNCHVGTCYHTSVSDANVYYSKWKDNQGYMKRTRINGKVVALEFVKE